MIGIDRSYLSLLRSMVSFLLYDISACRSITTQLVDRTVVSEA